MNNYYRKKLLNVFLVIISIAGFFYLLTQKETISTKNSLLPSYIATPPQEESLSPVPSSMETLTAATETPKDTPTQKPLTTQQPNTSVSSSVYTPLQEGVSDTDELYVSSISPCLSAVGYTLGTVDERFGLSQAVVEKEVENAIKVWEDAAGKDLFFKNEQGPLTVHMIYDERQANTIHIGYTRLEIENTKKAADKVKHAYEQEKEVYTKDIASYEKDAQSYKERNAFYNKKVEDFNAQGGASRIEYDAMMLELEGLKKEADSLESRRLFLVESMNKINSRVARYNELVLYANTLIKKSNAVAAKKITEGRYFPNTLSIEIYQYSDMLKLKRVLIHEFGHALGILHNDNMRSVMYSFNSGTTTTLSKEDLEDLEKVCKK